MKITIDVEAVMEACRNCPNFDIKTIRLPRTSMHICKNVPICKKVIETWEAEHGKV